MKYLVLALGLSAMTVHAGTIAHYSFEGLDTNSPLQRLADSGGKGHHGRVIGQEPFEVATNAPRMVAPNGTALDARGRNDYAVIPHHSDFAPAGDWTIEFFLKPAPFHQQHGGATGIAGIYTFLNSNPSYTILAKPVTDKPTFFGSAWAFHYQPANGYVIATISFGSDKGETLIAGMDMRDGEWHHIALSVHKGFGTEVRLYVDGFLTMSTNAHGGDQPIPFGEGPIYVGAFARQNSEYSVKDRNFDGFLDEIRFSDAALDTSELAVDLSLRNITTEIYKAIELRFPTADNKFYRVEGSLDGNTWDVLGHVLGDGGQRSFHYRKETFDREYRVVPDDLKPGEPPPSPTTFVLSEAVEVRFPTDHGQIYRIAWTTDFSDEGPEATFLLGDGGKMSFYDRAVPGESRFYTVNRY